MSLQTAQASLEACEREQLALEAKYGLSYDDFKRELESGSLGDEFAYEIEMDAIHWEDLIAEKRHRLEQLSAIRVRSQ